MQELRITGGFLRSRKVSFQSAETLRPTLSKAREAIFNVLAGYVNFEESSFLDAFAGSGIMSFEAISRGFRDVFAIETNPKTCNNIKQNAELLSVNLTLIKGSIPHAFSNLQIKDRKFSVIFLDPPYMSDLYRITLDKILEAEILDKNGIVVIESLPNINIDAPKLDFLKQKTYSDKNVTFLIRNN